jgi:hypothetical protein
VRTVGLFIAAAAAAAAAVAVTSTASHQLCPWQFPQNQRLISGWVKVRSIDALRDHKQLLC